MRKKDLFIEFLEKRKTYLNEQNDEDKRLLELIYIAGMYDLSKKSPKIFEKFLAMSVPNQE